MAGGSEWRMGEMAGASYVGRVGVEEASHGRRLLRQEPDLGAWQIFHNSWRGRWPLADYTCTVAPDITAKCKAWERNDGDGLEAADAVALADRLQTEIDTGRAVRYAQVRASELEALPKVP